MSGSPLFAAERAAYKDLEHVKRYGRGVVGQCFVVRREETVYTVNGTLVIGMYQDKPGELDARIVRTALEWRKS